MRMNYQERNKNKKLFLGLAVTLLIGVAVLVFKVGSPWLNSFFSPLLSFSSNLKDGSVSILSTSFQEKTALSERIGMLERENERLRLMSRDRDLIHEENKKLKRELGRDEETAPFILGRVLSKPPISPFDILTIDLGEKHGIEKGARVYVTENTEIGFVSEVFANHSMVTLYSSAKERTPVEINNGGSLVIAEGEGGGSVIIQAPRTLEVKKGDLLFRPSLSSTIMGVVESAEIGETDSFMTVHGKLPVNIFEITWVYIKTSKN